ncbi:hypothetical protein CONPUDRAFT_82782 [Coniophora puteana RWD-64-598 SS2]|uniref:G-protein coupled receptors family 1 profile domain-containing protein n=1 Tax=Coniophora puteana (strain RWD-64-598) TaxID=741705 RepID=A0A5M3MNE9_CONPW|nr:uncharacterized protein CONPUDRAFT_82782 [Coniophora puteana RWD-64-598 SS2]EIW80633.1 hypothetical protein CONPUDRAFT_82782 [Coniophora puteana RWD-64-598 SS2]
MLTNPRGILVFPTLSTLDGPPGNPADMEANARFTASIEIIGSMTVGGTFYGFTTATAALCAHTLVQTRAHRSRRRLAFLLAYVGVLWALGTVLIGGTSRVWLETYVINAASALEYPYVRAPAEGAAALVVNTAYWVILMLTDGAMIWRFKVVWSGSRFYRYLMVSPVLLYLVIIIPGFCVYVLSDSRSAWGPPDNVNLRLISAVTLSSFCLNVYATALIAGRLFVYRRRFRANWGTYHPAPR